MVTIELQQALHGYDRGHRLIAGSLPLDGNSRRLVDSLSDASGTNLEGSPDAFPYLTGYPLPDGMHYTLAKTWLAKGPSRPGTVWTHSLFISLIDLAKLPALSPLLSVFREPSDLSENAEYAKALRVTLPNVWKPTDEHEDVVRALLWGLYAKPDQTVALVDEAPSTLLSLFTALWSQQWPRLRRNFTFCTGGVELRKIGEKAFDLQATKGRTASLSRADVNVVKPHKGENSVWLNTLAHDLSDPSDDLRRFLFQFGAELSGGRRAMQALVELYNALRALEEPTALRTLMDTLATEPSLAEGVRLRQALLTNRTRGGLLPDTDEHYVLTLIGTSSDVARLDGSKLHLPERVEALGERSPVLSARLTRTLLRRHNQHGRDMLEPLLSSLTSEGLQIALWHNPDLLVKAIAVRPELAYHVEVWRQPQRVQETIFRELAVRKEASWWLPVVRAMLVAESSFAAKSLSERFTSVVQEEVLDQYAEKGYLPEAWLEQVVKGSVIAPWLAARQHAALAGIQRVVTLSHPGKKAFTHHPTSLWLTLARRAQGAREFAPLMVFILCIGFYSTPSQRDVLFLSALKDVFSALDEGALEAREKTWLRDVLSPKPFFYFGPYPPELALSRAVVRSLIEQGVPAAPFLSSLDASTQARLLRVRNIDEKARSWFEGGA